MNRQNKQIAGRAIDESFRLIENAGVPVVLVECKAYCAIQFMQTYDIYLPCGWLGV